MVKVENLCKVFGANEVIAVDDITFKIPTGNIACIVGTSGCGKTTTLKMINRLVEPSSGKVWIENEEASRVAPITWRRKIGYVIQKGGLLPHLTVQENISLLSKALNRKKKFIHERVEELLVMIGLDPKNYRNRYPAELSGGQQQRVGIARALMENPPILLMDEPFGALDPIIRSSMHEEFWELNQKLKKTILIVTHDLNEAFKLGDEVILMQKGKIIQSGTRSDFDNNPANEFVKEFMSGKY